MPDGSFPVVSGTSPVVLTASTPPATIAALAPTVTVGSVTIASPPVVRFAITDVDGNGIVNFGKTRQGVACASSRSNEYSVDPQLANMAFSLAKYVPGAAVPGTSTTLPGKWVSYLVTTAPAKNAKTGDDVPVAASRPGTDNTGKLVDRGDGTYSYEFSKDITTTDALVKGLTDDAGFGALGGADLAYDPNAVHRLTIQISGDAWGSGKQTADCSVAATPTAIPLKNPVNVVYDFIPATGKAVAPADTTVQQRLIVDKASCNECHGKLGGIPGTESQTFHGGSRYDPKYCVVCHTDQRKYGRTPSTSVNGVFTGSTYVADGVTLGDFPVLIHRVHKGEGLKKTGYNYAGVLLNETRYPQDYRNCTKCHDDTAPKVAPQASNWKMVPSRLACGACHDGINWATGQGTTNAGLTTGHVGGAKQDDKLCALCHDSATIPLYHIPVTNPAASNYFSDGGSPYSNAAWIASNVNNLPAGAIKVDYDIKSVVRNASRNVEVTFKMLQNGVAVPFNTPSAATDAEIWNNFMGAPSIECAWAEPQDGITAPADFNKKNNAYIRSLWNGTAGGTLSARDPDGYYKATLTGFTVPDTAVMLSCGLGYEYSLNSKLPLTQTNLADYPISAAVTNGFTGISKPAGGLIVATADKQLVASAGSGTPGTGGAYTGRRAIVSDALCNQCHLELGVFAESSFHAGQRNDATTCSWCHTPNQTSSGWTADSTNFVHAIHASSKRTVAYNWHATSATDNFSKVEYPGILSKCETCHLPGTYDFSATASAAALPNRLVRTTAASTLSASVSLSPYVTAGVPYGATRDDNLVLSPISASCFSCHDSTVAKDHMEANGGSIYKTRTVALAKSEQCMFCHKPDSAFGLGIKEVHAK